jgi:hypothetical protein
MADQEKKTQKKKRAQLGKLPRRYRFFLNPYEDVRFPIQVTLDGLHETSPWRVYKSWQ